MNMGAYLHVQPRLQRCMEVRCQGVGWGWGEVGVGCRGPLLHCCFVLLRARKHCDRRYCIISS